MNVVFGGSRSPTQGLSVERSTSRLMSRRNAAHRRHPQEDLLSGFQGISRRESLWLDQVLCTATKKTLRKTLCETKRSRIVGSVMPEFQNERTMCDNETMTAKYIETCCEAA
ncbi:hypothetical protein PYCCODRAFT_1041658 [Trametes coccinea BRFM310]|uniref:Uncharacterized protein n=1 Tax=Trametes coccinea (strain BRFM310) TaxID=1353009 RepID=A0A1Y2IA71_TRAC3|nr:hypothetical protein PYCCODRAFT_1041658 [Trametes coccinea BRFM310]